MKKIISLIFLSVLMLMTCSCEVAPQTVTPTDTTGEVTPTATPTPTAEATLTPTPTLEDTLPHPTEFLHKAGMQYYVHGYFGIPQINVYDDDESKEHLVLNVLIGKKTDGNLVNIEHCTWHVLYYNADVEMKSVEDFIGYYTVNLVSVEEQDEDYNLYKLKISDLKEGDFIKNFEVGNTYMLYLTMVSKEKDPRFTFTHIYWTEELAEIRDNFYATNSND